ncbi:MAG TPA: type II secretion system F family protein [Pirellulaceae bacterium]|nr:type II secretion system F family protein [Pirellulaceae bacterium]
MTFQITFVVALWLLAAAATFWLIRRLALAGETRRRAFADVEEEARQSALLQTDEMGALRSWLFLSGYRRESAVVWFLVASLLTMLVGAGITAAIFSSGIYRLMVESTASVPGGVGEVFLPVVYVAPWLLLILAAGLPALAVYQRRKRRMESVDQDLPLTLELLSTLSEAGLGFDAALLRIAETRLAERPLAQEFRTYQADLLAGRSRVQSLRRLSDRLRMPVVATFVSALVQAEQLGMGIAQVLRRQADDVRDRRRERANAFALSLPVKRVVPLVVCFLPGLFVWAMGPFFVQLFQLADTFARVRDFGGGP